VNSFPCRASRHGSYRKWGTMKHLLLQAAGVLVGLLVPVGTFAAEREDLLVNDFEGKDYGDWKTTGTAFGPGPAQGTLPNQMPVTGYKGKGLVNSFHGGDQATGTLTSPPFKVERKFLNFLIGGGMHPGETCINLLEDGKVVRTATGPNDRPGGSEQLDWHTWDVDELAGKSVVIEIVDKHTGGWGHVNVDHIVQSDRKLQAVPTSREVAVEARYLHLPVKNGAPKRRMSFIVDDKTVREFEIELAEDAPDWWAFSDVTPWKGKKLRVEVTLPGDSRALEALTQGDEIKGEELYKEKLRPLFHFTSRRGWLNDPNGLVYAQGDFHLFYQHNPFGWDWGNMHWGHAVSKDLVHWQELGEAIYPQRFGDWAFSGSAIVDAKDTAGLKKGDEPALVAAYTSTGRGECVAFSNDRGRTWSQLPDNPVIKHAGRDPRLLWHEPTKRWVMAVYDEHEGKQWIALHTSADLKKWEFQSRIEGFFECPDLFELPVDGGDKKKWLLYAADGKYLVGDFDGKAFTKESGKHQLWYGNFYAAQTFSNTPDGRRVQIGWGQGITFPGMPFNQQMTVPCQLTLRTTADGVRMFAEPVKEVESLRGEPHTWEAKELPEKAGRVFEGIRGESFDVRAEFEVKDGVGVVFAFDYRGATVTYHATSEELNVAGKKASLKAVDGKVKLRLLVDRCSFEAFGNEGAVAVSAGFRPADGKSQLTLRLGEKTKVRSLDVFDVKSAWDKP
jgi:fructan beta-fructosidase